MTSTTAKRYTTTEYGKQNMFASEPPMEYVENYEGYWKNAERTNGRLAMIGLFAAIHNYAIFGWVIPGIAQSKQGLFKFYPYYKSKNMKENAELQNGRWAMIGIIAGLGAYLTTGQLIPGIF